MEVGEGVTQIFAAFLPKGGEGGPRNHGKKGDCIGDDDEEGRIYDGYIDGGYIIQRGGKGDCCDCR